VNAEPMGFAYQSFWL